jgi:membrane fusion protein (multidrug efflux system)
LIISGIAVFVINSTGLVKPEGYQGGYHEGQNLPPDPDSPLMGQNTNSTIFAVNVIEVTKSSIEDYIRINGDVITETNINIYPDNSGKLVKLFISLGDYVVKGQVIAEVDPSKPGMQYSTNPVKSTITGTVTDLPVKTGSTVTIQTPVATIGDLSNVLIQCFIAERFISQIEMGLKAEIQFEAYPDDIFPASVNEISPLLDKETRTLEVRLKLNNPDNRIKVGMFAFVTRHKDGVIVIPDKCLMEDKGEISVYVVKGDNTVERRTIQSGIRMDGLVEITGGLMEGEIVVTGGQFLLYPGAAVKIVE